MVKTLISVRPTIRSKPTMPPNLMEMDIENLRELYFNLNKACYILKSDNCKPNFYNDWKIARNLVVKRLSALIQL